MTSINGNKLRNEGFTIINFKPDKVITEDEEYTKFNEAKFPALRAVFKKDGTVTAGNASTLNDGACALVMMTAERAKELGCTPLARVRGFADAATQPIDFPIAPAFAVPKALKWAGVNKEDVSKIWWEIRSSNYSFYIYDNI